MKKQTNPEEVKVKEEVDNILEIEEEKSIPQQIEDIENESKEESLPEEEIKVNEDNESSINNDIDEELIANAKIDSEEEIINLTESLKSSEEEINSIRFLSDQVRFNSTIHQGMGIILQRLTAIEGILNEKK